MKLVIENKKYLVTDQYHFVITIDFISSNSKQELLINF